MCLMQRLREFRNRLDPSAYANVLVDLMAMIAIRFAAPFQQHLC